MSAEADGGAARRTTVTVRDLLRMKREGEKIAVLTCYDHLFARLLSRTSIDAVLVGDSLGQVMLGYRDTLPVTVDEMVHHAAAVRRGLEGPMLIVDLPFMSYQTSDEEALHNAGRLFKETGCEAVKLEGGDPASVSRARRIVEAGMPVMGHLGLTPQALHRLGGYRVTGRAVAEAERMVDEAGALEDAGCFALVLELVPADLAARITAAAGIPTIGIGAGPACDGQVLVLPDMLGLNPGFQPRFLRRFAELGEETIAATGAFVDAVRSAEYPGPAESYET